MSSKLQRIGLCLVFAFMLAPPVVAGAHDGMPPPIANTPLQGVAGPGPTVAAQAASPGGQKRGDSKQPSDFNHTYPLPIWLTIVISLSTLVAALAGAFVGLFVTPRTMRKIADAQGLIAKQAADAAVTSASASNENAKAAAKSAAAAVENANTATRNMENTGVHQVARLRQEWINTLRDELSALHSLLTNWSPLGGADSMGQADQDARARDANTRLARVELLLNTREAESYRLIDVLHELASPDLPAAKRRWLGRWMVRWGRVVLKIEWDRVRAELRGSAWEPPKRRDRSRRSGRWRRVVPRPQ